MYFSEYYTSLYFKWKDNIRRYGQIVSEGMRIAWRLFLSFIESGFDHVHGAGFFTTINKNSTMDSANHHQYKYFS